MEMATAVAIGKLALKLGETGWNVYCEASKENVEAFSQEKVDSLLAEHQSTEEIISECKAKRK